MLNKKNTILSIIIIICIIAAAGYYTSIRFYSLHGNRIKKIVVGDDIFYSEIVSSVGKMQKGLGSRNDICQSCAMLFRFSKPGKYAFSMKDMRFPLDIIWILNGKVVHIRKNVSEKSTSVLVPPSDANQVLEINAGLSGKLDIKIGDKVVF